MTAFDVNTAVGHWPFRRIPCQIPSDLRMMLENGGIGGAAVANTNGLFYKNCHDANLELAEWIAPHEDFFAGVATLNPLYAAWERDLCVCREKLRFRALRMVPQYHDYRLNCTEAVAMAQLATDSGLPLMVPHRLVDVRQRHWFDTERTIEIDEICALCEAVPEARVIVTESRFPASALLKKDGAMRHTGLYLESSRTDVGSLPQSFVAERVVFGTGAPFKHVKPAFLKLDVPDFSPETRARVVSANGRALLGLGRPDPR